MQTNKNADLSFNGLNSFANRLIYGNSMIKPEFERTAKRFESIADFCNHAASA